MDAVVYCNLTYSSISGITDLIAQSSKHERCAAVVVCLVHSKHHDQVLDDSWTLTHCYCHVQGVRVILGAERDGEKVIR